MDLSHKQDKHIMDLGNANVFKNSNRFSKSYISKNVKYCLAQTGLAISEVLAITCLSYSISHELYENLRVLQS